MPLYKFSLYECGSQGANNESRYVLIDIAAARIAAVKIAREVMSRELLAGKICLSCWIVISDEAGHNLSVVQFGEALEIVTEQKHCQSLGRTPPNIDAPCP